MSKLMRQAIRMGSARANHTCTLIPGDGIGPEISESVQQIFQAAGVSIYYLYILLDTVWWFFLVLDLAQDEKNFIKLMNTDL